MIILAATPIGNLGDASPRLVAALEAAEVIAAEDTRTTVRLLSALKVQNRPRLIALHDHNEKQKAAELAQMAETIDLLVLSDAGMPTVSDPGYGLVAAAAERGVTVTVIPGPSAVVSALAVSGLPTDRFTFEGFLPRKPSERRATLTSLAREPRTMVFFESATRLASSLADMATTLGTDRRVAVCRELTKMYEEVRRGTAAELVAWAEQGVKGEICIVVEGASAVQLSLPDAVAAVLELVQAGVRMKDAATDIARQTGHPGRELYAAALEAKKAIASPR